MYATGLYNNVKNKGMAIDAYFAIRPQTQLAVKDHNENKSFLVIDHNYSVMWSQSALLFPNT